MKRIGFRSQRTLAAAAEVTGRGFITGTPVRLGLLPAAPDSGVRFVRADLPGRPEVAALSRNVTNTQRRTTIESGRASVTMVEHVLAALAGLRIDNCTLELDGPEPPGLDGSAAEFVRAIWAAGAKKQAGKRSIWTVSEPLTVRRGGATLTLHPSDEPGLRVSYTLDYGPFSAIRPQSHTRDLSVNGFAQEIAGCRTFLLEEEAKSLQSQGIGAHVSPADVLVFGKRGPIDNRLRFADEPCRHKILDLIGDLSLCGVDLAGHVVAYRSGHPLNVELASMLVAGMGSVVKPACLAA